MRSKNVARLLSSLGQYIYTSNEDSIYTHLYIGGEAELEVGSAKVYLKQETAYPWTGSVKLTIMNNPEKEVNICLRIPDWCKKASIKINGSELPVSDFLLNGYAKLNRLWKTGDSIELQLEMTTQLLKTNPKVRANTGRVAIQRGPLVYCLEGVDNGNNLQALVLDSSNELEASFEKEFFGGAIILKGKAYRDKEEAWEGSLYRSLHNKNNKNDKELVDLKAIPYYLWANRGVNEMLVWIRCY